jgi:ppGpp synthetase/RelA/SpoT-type nucleotidyltranferase
MPTKPATLEEYLAVDGPCLNFPLKIKYQMNLNLIEKEVAGCDFIGGLEAILNSAARQYSQNEQLLFASKIYVPTLLSKSYESAIDKCYRNNCVFNKKYPSPPAKGFFDGSNLYESINDLLRCRIVCRYMDGPEFVCNILADFAKSLNLECNVYAMSSERGYYAWHFYVRIPANVIVDSDVEEKFVSVEIQVTTQLADVLTHLTHGLYEAERSAVNAAHDDSWKWDPAQPKFKTTFMGHTLHMLEGALLSLKDEVFATKCATIAEQKDEAGTIAVAAAEIDAQFAETAIEFTVQPTEPQGRESPDGTK